MSDGETTEMVRARGMAMGDVGLPRSCARRSQEEALSLQREWAMRPQSLQTTAWRRVSSRQTRHWIAVEVK